MTRFCFMIPLLILVTLSSSVCMQAAEAVRVVTVPNGGAIADAERDSDGTIHMVYDAGNEPYYVKSTDDGVTFSQPLKIIDAAARKPGLEYSCWDMAVGKKGQVHVVLGTNAWKLKLPQNEWGMFYASLDSGANAFTPVRNINHKPSEGYSVAVDENDTVALSWLSGKLYTNISHDGGKTFGPNTEISPSYDPCNCCTTRIAYGADGTLACLYREETGNQRDMYVALLSKDGKQTREKVSGTPWSINACPMTYFAISPTKDGFAAAWPIKGEIYFAKLGSDGKVLPPGEIKTAGKNGMRTGILALSNAQGETLVAWNHGGKANWQVYDTKGLPQGEAGSAPAKGTGIAGVVTKEGGFLLFP